LQQINFQNQPKDSMSIILEPASIISPLKVIENGTLIINENGWIEYCGNREQAPKVSGKRLNIKGKIIAPGFIDIHVHGGHGIAFGIGNLADELEKYSQWVVSGGVTGFLLSISAPDADSTCQLIQEYVKILEEGTSGATALGLHLEGPFLNPEKKGAFNAKWLHAPDPKEAKKYLKLGKGWIKQITIAPELPNAREVAALMHQAGVKVALGHSNAEYETAGEALKGNFTHITHSFNAQSGFNQRDPGVFGAVMASEHATAELIADGVHVHPGAMKILLRCLGKDRICLITDAMPGAGLPDGDYHLIGQHVTVRDGKAILDDGTIAGSTVQMNQCVRNLNQMVGATLQDAAQMASINPADVIGESKTIGSLEPGKWANLVVMDEKVNIHLTMVKGRVVYNKL
jgi:N-acetylglucosamine-6-phosphate deacetylase